MEEQAFAAVEKAEAAEVIPHKGEVGDAEDVPIKGGPGTAGAALADEEFGAEVAVAVHVFEVVVERGVGVMDEVEIEGLGSAVEDDGFVDGTLFKAGLEREVGGGAAEKAQLGVGVIAAVLDPTAEKKVAAVEKKGVGWRI